MPIPASHKQVYVIISALLPMVPLSLTLSQKLKKQEDLEAYATSFPNAVLTRHEHIVTHPDVDWALYLWVKSMEAKSKVVTGSMLCTKSRFFEQELRVPEEVWLQGAGWLASYKKA